MSEQYATVTLSEHRGDETVYLVPFFILEWINQPYNGDTFPMYNEPVPDDVLNFFRESVKESRIFDLEDVQETVSVTTGSTQNDRALQMIVSDAFTFYTLAEAIAYATKNDLEVKDTFNGLCY